MESSTGGEPYALSRGEGRPIWFLGTLMTVKAASEQTQDAYTLIECALPAGFAPPPHVHRAEEEAFYLLEGEITVFCGDQTWTATPGSFIFLPRQIVHWFRVKGTAPARMLQITSPAGFEHFAAAMGEPAEEPILPPPGPPDVEKLLALAAKYNIEIKGSPPGHEPG